MIFLNINPNTPVGISPINGSISGPVAGVVVTAGAGKTLSPPLVSPRTGFCIQNCELSELCCPFSEVAKAWFTTQVIP